MARKSSTKRKTSVLAQEHGSPWLQQHVPVVVDETMAAGITRARVKHECRLDWYLDRMMLTDRQHAAGIVFRTKWLLGAASTHVTSGYGNRISGSADFAVAQISARRWMKRALDEVGMRAGEVLISVCGMDEWASGDLPILRVALDDVADMEGMERH
jgi:hypothetical protein